MLSRRAPQDPSPTFAPITAKPAVARPRPPGPNGQGQGVHGMTGTLQQRHHRLERPGTLPVASIIGTTPGRYQAKSPGPRGSGRSHNR
jgi:hypothetical protein